MLEKQECTTAADRKTNAALILMNLTDAEMTDLLEFLLLSPPKGKFPKAQLLLEALDRGAEDIILDQEVYWVRQQKETDNDSGRSSGFDGKNSGGQE